MSIRNFLYEAVKGGFLIFLYHYTINNSWENIYIIFATFQYCAVDKIEKNEMGWAFGAYGWGEGGIESCWRNRRERDHWGDLGIDGWIILGWISRRWDMGIWTGLGWPRIETGGGRLWVRKWTFGFREIRGISWLAANRLAAQEGLCTVE